MIYKSIGRPNPENYRPERGRHILLGIKAFDVIAGNGFTNSRQRVAVGLRKEVKYDASCNA